MTGRDPAAGEPTADDGWVAELVARVRRLRRLRRVPDELLIDVVGEYGLVREVPPASALDTGGGVTADRELAAGLCAGCPVIDECLELDLRWMADRTVGVFAGLTETDRRAAYALWAAERHDSGQRPDDAE